MCSWRDTLSKRAQHHTLFSLRNLSSNFLQVKYMLTGFNCSINTKTKIIFFNIIHSPSIVFYYRHNLFYCALLYCNLQILHFEVDDNSASSKSVGAIFPIAFVLFMSLCHMWAIVSVFQTFSLLLYFYGDLWSVIFGVTTMIHWRLRWWLAFSSNKVFLIKVGTFLYIMLLHT